MPKLPRDLSGDDLVKALRKYGYEVSRQRGSHMLLTTTLGGEHHVAVPRHKPLKIGTLSKILDMVGRRLNRSRDELARELFG